MPPAEGVTAAIFRTGAQDIITVLDGVEVFVGVKLIGGDLDHRNGNVRAVVGDALIVGQQIVQHKSRTRSCRHRPAGGRYGGSDLAHKAVHDLLQRLDLLAA